MHILIVDDEPLARARLRTLLLELDAQATPPGPHRISEAADVPRAMQCLLEASATPVELLLLDIHMPGQDGLELTRLLRHQEPPPAVVFVTAHAGHAVQAFELEAVDYLTKPVRRERLCQALERAGNRLILSRLQRARQGAAATLTVHEHGSTLQLPLAEVLYFRAEQKYVLARTVRRSHLLDGSLNDLQEKHGQQFLRVHRNALVARHALRSLHKRRTEAGAEAWRVGLHGLAEELDVSRRQLPFIRALLSQAGDDVAA